MKTILTLAATLLLAYGSTAAPNAVPACDDTGTVVHTAKPRRVKGSERLVTRDLGRIGAYEVLYVSDGIEAVVSAAVSTLVITADDNVIDRIVTRSDGKRLTMRIDARSITDCTVRAVIPASAALRTLEAESMGTIRCEVPLGNGPVTVRSSEGSRIAADIRTGDDIRVHVSECSRFEGALKGNNCKISVTEGSVFDAPLTCEVHGEIILDASGRFAGDASAGNSLHIKAANGSVMQGNADADVVLVHATASSHYNGSISAAGQAELKSTDGSVIAGAFAGGHIYAVSTASSRIALTGSTPVPSAVIEVASGSRFSAPALPLRNCSVTATSSGHAEVRCTDELLATTSSGGTVFYNGDCRVTTNNSYVRKQD